MVEKPSRSFLFPLTGRRCHLVRGFRPLNGYSACLWAGRIVIVFRVRFRALWLGWQSWGRRGFMTREWRPEFVAPSSGAVFRA
jgi:hypothetical protein